MSFNILMLLIFNGLLETYKVHYLHILSDLVNMIDKIFFHILYRIYM